MQLDLFLQQPAVVCGHSDCSCKCREHELLVLSDQRDCSTSDAFAESIKAVVRFRMAEVWNDLLAIVGCIQWLLTPRADAPTIQPVFDLVGAKEGTVTFSERDLGFAHVLC
ncbi:hypothetical protein BKN46_07155 [Pseudomonas aeruginosa]|nr:hypothetical protein APB10_22635 [Pseudomonas aeruginosa]MCO1698386.1 hypothetical protein [Pseudomonas aeruginosa]MCO3485998.1 hypothetical protein [Pseudomonas aeruginosa]MCO3595724.1 hypothetical protein [Pseudomonas aeruginosa]MDV6544340.1 hypothetical protein [Pseudomonas aeruginosa]